MFLHAPTEYPNAVVLNPKAFPGVLPGDIIHISPAVAARGRHGGTGKGSAGHMGPGATGARHLGAEVGSGAGGAGGAASPAAGTGAGVGTGAGGGVGGGAGAGLLAHGLVRTVRRVEKSAGTWSLSLLRSVAAAFKFRRQRVTVRAVTPEQASLTFAEVTFKDQYVPRSDMWSFRQAITGSCVYLGEYVTRRGVRVQLTELSRHGESVRSGLITQATRLVFRSRSARFVFLVQLSREMWEFADDGQLHFERAVDRFFKVLFDKWLTAGVGHTAQIIFFTRTVFEQTDRTQRLMNPASRALCSDGRRLYEDTFHVVAQATPASKCHSLLGKMRAAFLQFPKIAGWGSSEVGFGVPCRAREGNVLEAINLMVNDSQLHFIDRDLSHQGQHLAIVSAGSAVFDVDEPLARLTERRLLDCGIGANLICVVRPPLHMVPLLLFRKEPGEEDAAQRFLMPTWLLTSFFGPGVRRLQPTYVPWTSVGQHDVFSTFKRDPSLDGRSGVGFQAFGFECMAGGELRVGNTGNSVPSSLLRMLDNFGRLQVAEGQEPVGGEVGVVLEEDESEAKDESKACAETPPLPTKPRRSRRRALSMGSGTDHFQAAEARAQRPASGVQRIASNASLDPWQQSAFVKAAVLRSRGVGGGPSFGIRPPSTRSLASTGSAGSGGTTERGFALAMRSSGLNLAASYLPSSLIIPTDTMRFSVGSDSSYTEMLMSRNRASLGALSAADTGSRSSLARSHSSSASMRDIDTTVPADGTDSFAEYDKRVFEKVDAPPAEFLATSRPTYTKQDAPDGQPASATSAMKKSTSASALRNMLTGPSAAGARTKARRGSGTGKGTPVMPMEGGHSLDAGFAPPAPASSTAYRSGTLGRVQLTPPRYGEMKTSSSPGRDSWRGSAGRPRGSEPIPVRRHRSSSVSSQRLSTSAGNAYAAARPPSWGERDTLPNRLRAPGRGGAGAVGRLPAQTRRRRNQQQTADVDPGLNPFTPHARDVEKSLWRWHHVRAAGLPLLDIAGNTLRPAGAQPGSTKYLTMGRKMTSNHWKSLVEPATLPLTTDFLPKRTELQNKKYWNVDDYDIVPLPDDLQTVGYANIAAVLREMVAQRLAQDYQLVENQPSSFPGTGDGPKYTLVVGQHVHFLWMQGSEAILVEMYSRVNAEQHNHEYRYMLFCARSQKCCPTGQVFAETVHADYRWNYLDQVVSLTSPSTYINDLNYKRVLFLLIPIELQEPDDEVGEAAPGEIAAIEEVADDEDGDAPDTTRHIDGPASASGVGAAGAGAGAGAGAAAGWASSASRRPAGGVRGAGLRAWWYAEPLPEERQRALADGFEQFCDYLRSRSQQDIVIRVRRPGDARHIVPRSNGRDSGSVRILLKSGERQSNKAEWLLLQHANVFNPCHAFSLELRFLVAGAQEVNRLTVSLARRAKQAGFHLSPVAAYSRSMGVCGDDSAVDVSALASAGDDDVRRQVPAVHAPTAATMASITTASHGRVRTTNTSRGALTAALKPPFLSTVRLPLSATTTAAVVARRKDPTEVLSWLFTDLMGALEASLVSRFGFYGDVAFGGVETSDTDGDGIAPRVALPTTIGVDDTAGLVTGDRLVSLALRSRLNVGWFIQYVHRSTSVFVRIERAGVFWIPNLLPGHESPEEAEDEAEQVGALFGAVSAFCEAFSAATDVVEELLRHLPYHVDPRAPAAAAAELEPAAGTCAGPASDAARPATSPPLGRATASIPAGPAAEGGVPTSVGLETEPVACTEGSAGVHPPLAVESADGASVALASLPQVERVETTSASGGDATATASAAVVPHTPAAGTSVADSTAAPEHLQAAAAAVDELAHSAPDAAASAGGVSAGEGSTAVNASSPQDASQSPSRRDSALSGMSEGPDGIDSGRLMEAFGY